jgi:Tfp pilus assembly protein FimT
MKKLMLIAAILAMVIVAAVPAIAQISQENEQDADSGDIDQSFNVTGGGANSNQCVGVQGAANTGNAQNQIGLIQYASEADDFEFEDVGASIDVSPTNTTSCTQQVNQAASASGK